MKILLHFILPITLISCCFGNRKCPEGNNRRRVPDPGNGLQLFRNEPAHVLAFIEIELHHEVVSACRGIDFRGDFRICYGRGHLVGFSEFTLDLDEKCFHGLLTVAENGWASA